MGRADMPRTGVIELECHSPVLGIMWLLVWIANASMARCKNSLSLAITIHRIQLELHEFIHVPQYQHITVELDHPVIFFEREGRELAPAIIESWVIGKVFVN